MTAEERQRPRLSSQKMVRIAGVLLTFGVFLFWRVWCPIQAERALMRLKSVQNEVSLKKSELNELEAAYQHLTPLSALDQWAKAHEPWKTPSENDVITIIQ